MKITNENYKNVSGLFDFLKYVKNCLERDISKIPDQDYIDLDYLFRKFEVFEKDLQEYSEKLKSGAPYIFDGNLIRIDTTDGISFVTYKYYQIIESSEWFKKGWFLCDVLEVTTGEYETGIVQKTREKIESKEFIKEYLRFYHKTGLELQEEWEKYISILKSITFPK